MGAGEEPLRTWGGDWGGAWYEPGWCCLRAVTDVGSQPLRSATDGLIFREVYSFYYEKEKIRETIEKPNCKMWSAIMNSNAWSQFTRSFFFNFEN